MRSARRLHWLRSTGIWALVSMLVCVATPRFAVARIQGTDNTLTPVAFESHRDGNGELYVADPVGGAQRNVTNAPASNEGDPSWGPPVGSPGCRSTVEVAFTSDAPGDIDVFTTVVPGVDADDGSTTAPQAWMNLTHSPASDQQPAWSPATSTRFALPSGVLAQRLIAFTSNRDGDNDIWVMGESGADPTNLTRNTADDQHPDWSPDGRFIAFDSDTTGSRQIFVLDVLSAMAGGGTPQQLTFGEGAAEPSWITHGRASTMEDVLPDGLFTMVQAQRIAFTAAHDGVTFVDMITQAFPTEIAPPPPSIGVGPLTLEAMTGDPGDDGSPVWSGMGYSLIYASGAPGQRDLFMLTTPGSPGPVAQELSAPVSLASAPGDDVNADWRAGSLGCAAMNPSPPRPRSVARTRKRLPAGIASGGSTGRRAPAAKSTARRPKLRSMRLSTRIDGARRRIVLHVSVDLASTARVRLSRGDRTVVRRTVRLRAGANRVSLAVPRRARAGRYRVTVRLGTARAVARSVRLRGTAR